jgi:hypothetical protein
MDNYLLRFDKNMHHLYERKEKIKNSENIEKRKHKEKK